MKVKFSTKKKVTKTVNTMFTYSQFYDTITVYKPTAIYNPNYTTKHPCWHLTNYGTGTVEYYADAWADKTPIWASIEHFYKQLTYQGLADCYFVYK